MESKYRRGIPRRKASLIDLKKFLLYVIVGGLATLVEWGCFGFFRKSLSIQYMAATVLAIIISTFSNWLFGKLIVFRNFSNSFDQILTEIFQIYVASAVGLAINLFLMWLLHGQMHISDMLSKIIATGVAFLYNYLIRIMVIYRKA